MSTTEIVNYLYNSFLALYSLLYFVLIIKILDATKFTGYLIESSKSFDRYFIPEIFSVMFAFMPQTLYILDRLFVRKVYWLTDINTPIFWGFNITNIFSFLSIIIWLLLKLFVYKRVGRIRYKETEREFSFIDFLGWFY